MNICSLTLSLILHVHIASFTLAEGDHGAPKANSRFQEGSAVTAFNTEDGFKINDVALGFLGVQFSRLNGKGPWNIPKEALVRVKHLVGVYRRSQGWIKFVSIHAEDLKSGDEIAIQGVSFLRMTEAELNSDAADEDHH